MFGILERVTISTDHHVWQMGNSNSAPITKLHDAARDGDLELVKKLIRAHRSDVNKVMRGVADDVCKQQTSIF
jgi:hypothetical protein